MKNMIGKDGRPFTQSYLKRIHSVLVVIFNHAVKYYDLPRNPAYKVGSMGSEKGIQREFWT